ncbi:hypothetical protein [Nocardioides sp. Root140]|uniref:hypothetical protein n=1 Tax=Nocardioides sp. Root140 TaxID=1736460 RepID=UPI0006F27F08|nr:hypothetical protein [Nocardioides sp. Root140]KQY49590.1 hypothetical protein ASD30_22835 [Nocardioides sp. Root140]
MRFTRRLAAATATVALLATTTACGGGDDEPEATPSSSTPTTQSPSPTEPSPTETAWQDKYTEAQLDAYEAALSRYREYETRSEPIWAEGKATGRAEALFKQYFPSPLWQGQDRLLSSYEQGGVTRTGLADVYWSRAKSISDSGLSVVVNQCVDYGPIITEQNGKEAERPAWALKPNLRTISLEKPEGSDWLIYGVVDASSGKARPCKP